MSSKTAKEEVLKEYPRFGNWEFLVPIENIGIALKQVIVHTQLDIVGMGVAGTFTTMILMSMSLNPAPAIVGLIAFSVYVGDRISDIKREPSSTSDRSHFIRNHKQLLSIASAVAYGLAVTLALLGGPLTLAVTLIPGAAWIIYASDAVDAKALPLPKLKNLLIVNSSLVAFAWAAAMVLIPIGFVEKPITPVAIVLGTYFFLDIFINTEIPNVRDIEDDRENGVSTIPTEVGIVRTRSILYGLNFLLIVFLVGSGIGRILPIAFVGVLVVGRFVPLIINYGVGRFTNYRGLEIAGEMNYVLVLILLIFGL